MFASVNGYIDGLTIYRRHLVQPHELEKQPASERVELMRLLEERTWNEKCGHELQTIHVYLDRIEMLKNRLKNQRKLKKEFLNKKTFINIWFELKDTCKSLELTLFRVESPVRECSMLRNKLVDFLGPDEIVLYKTIRKQAVRQRMCANLRRSLAKSVYALAIDEIATNGFSRWPRIVDLLNKSSCMDYHAATFLLATFYAHGLAGLPLDTRISRAYLLRSAREGDRLSLLALGYRHAHGGIDDELPRDLDAAYFYYAQIAKIAKQEYYNPVEDENYPFFARLTEKQHLDAITNEDGGDLFEWLKVQAKKGVVSAQVNTYFKLC